MNKEILNYSLTSLKKIFDTITRFPAGQNSPMFSVWIDGLEVVSVTRQLDRLFDFMLFDFDCCQTLTVFVFDHSGKMTGNYEMKLPGNFHFQSEQEQATLRLEMAEGEIRHLKRELKKAERSRLYERPQDFKVVDAGNMLVLFVDKEQISQSMREQLATIENSAAMTKKAIRIFDRFIHPNEKE